MNIPDQKTDRRRGDIGPIPQENKAKSKRSCSGFLHSYTGRGQDIPTCVTGEFKKLIYGDTLK